VFSIKKMAKPKPKPPTRNTIARRLREAREAAGQTQQQLADSLDLTKQRVSEYERGLREPAASVLGRFAAALNVSADLLLKP
jgi:transcriptional regulator with XRE-family HTH domain